MPLSDPQTLQRVLQALPPDLADRVRQYVHTTENKDLIVLRIIERIAASLLSIEKSVDNIHVMTTRTAEMHGRIDRSMSTMPTMVSSSLKTELETHQEALARTQGAIKELSVLIDGLSAHDLEQRQALQNALAALRRLAEAEASVHDRKASELAVRQDRSSAWTALFRQALDNKMIVGGLGAIVQALLTLLVWALSRAGLSDGAAP